MSESGYSLHILRVLPFLRFKRVFVQECDPMLLKPMVDTFWNLTFDEQVGVNLHDCK